MKVSLEVEKKYTIRTAEGVVEGFSQVGDEWNGLIHLRNQDGLTAIVMTPDDFSSIFNGIFGTPSSQRDATLVKASPLIIADLVPNEGHAIVGVPGVVKQSHAVDSQGVVKEELRRNTSMPYFQDFDGNEIAILKTESGGMKGLDSYYNMTSSSTVPAIGQPWPEQGGVLAGIMPADGDQPPYYLILPTHPSAEHKGLKWGPPGDTDATSNCDGKKNTQLLATAAIDFPAAKFCASLDIGGFKDFYLPSWREASLMAATVPHLCRTGWHWTSTQFSSGSAFFQDFVCGGQGGYSKCGEGRVRAVRKVLCNN